MLRGVLSRVIERVLTLDRLIFMHEAGIPDSYTEEIFDPIISPRSFAVVAAMPAHLCCHMAGMPAHLWCHHSRAAASPKWHLPAGPRQQVLQSQYILVLRRKRN